MTKYALVRRNKALDDCQNPLTLTYLTTLGVQPLWLVECNFTLWFQPLDVLMLALSVSILSYDNRSRTTRVRVSVGRRPGAGSWTER
jgi:hypothetical protein